MSATGDQCWRAKPSYGICGPGPGVPKSVAPLALRSEFSSRTGESSVPQSSRPCAHGWQRPAGLFGAW
eukprot:4712988-Amphidinium_carterae.1